MNLDALFSEFVAEAGPDFSAETGPEAAEAILHMLAGTFFAPPGASPDAVVADHTADPASRYRMLLEQMAAVVFIAYMDAGVGEAYVSPHIEQMLGFTHQEWLEEPVRWYRQIHPEDKQRWSVDAARFFITGEPLRADYRVVAESGRVLWFHCQAKLVRRPDGQPLLVHGVGFDITDLKETEESLKQAVAAAEAASRVKSEFLANMSHEIRTPINGVMGMTNLALETSLTGEQREYLTTVKSSAESLLALVNDILDLSRIEEKKFTLIPTEFDVRACIEETARSLAQMAQVKGLEFFCYVAGDVPERATGDSARFRQILLNLIGNALKFTERGEVVVRTTVDSRGEKDVLLHVVVADTGIGVPEDKRTQIFGRFNQVDNSSRRRFGGAGLGLTISASLAQMLGGDIWLESPQTAVHSASVVRESPEGRSGSGSIFHFTARFTDPSPRIAGTPALSKRQVLVVAGRPTAREVLGGMLTDLGARPTIVEDVDSAFAALQAHPFDTILADADLESLTVLTSLPNCRTIILAPPGQRKDGNTYLSKPVWRSELIEAIGGQIPSPAPLAHQAASERPAARLLSILVAEDNPVNQRVAAGILRKHGHSVQVAGNGLEALDRSAITRFDLILMDVQMPEMDGYEATSAIRARTGGATPQSVPIIALTAHAMQGDRDKCLAVGMDAHVSKPIVLKQLFDTIEQLCG